MINMWPGGGSILLCISDELTQPEHATNGITAPFPVFPDIVHLCNQPECLDVNCKTTDIAKSHAGARYVAHMTV